MRCFAVPAAAVLTYALTWLSPIPTAEAQDAEANATVGGSLSMGGDSDAAADGAAGADEQPAADPISDEEAELAQRIIDMRESNSYFGPVGGIWVVDAGSGPSGSFRLSVMADFMAKGNFLYKDDQNTYGGTAFALSATPTEFLELSAAITARSLSNTNNVGSPGLLQVFGDTYLDVKAFTSIQPGMTIGGDIGLELLGGEDDVGKDFSATSAQLRVNFALDLRKMQANFPLQMRFNLGYRFDNSAKTVDGLEQKRLNELDPQLDPEFRHLVTRAERFAFNINRVDFLNLGVGAEFPIEKDKVVVSPLLEWRWGVPVNRQGFQCPYAINGEMEKLSGTDSCLEKEGIDTWPATLTAGLQLQPKRLEGLNLLAGIDVGLSGTRNFVQELAPNAPYKIIVGAGYAIDVRPREIVKEVEVKVEVPFEPPKGRVIGTVTEQDAQIAVAHPRVHFSGREVTDLFGGADGTFVSYRFAPGEEVNLDIEADGYEAGSCATIIPEDASDVELDCELIALPRVGSVKGLVIDGNGAPVDGVNVVVNGPSTNVFTTNPAGHFAGQDLPPGDYTARVDHEGHLIKIEHFTIKIRELSEPRIQLVLKPKNAQVRIRKDIIKLRSKVYFATDTAEIEPRSEPLMEELADLLIRNGHILEVEVQGHTDGTGGAAYNLRLSQERAAAVRTWLVHHGVEGERLVAKGYGADKTVAPNITPSNRAKNRRVELHITNQVAPSATPE